MGGWGRDTHLRRVNRELKFYNKKEISRTQQPSFNCMEGFRFQAYFGPTIFFLLKSHVLEHSESIEMYIIKHKKHIYFLYYSTRRGGVGICPAPPTMGCFYFWRLNWGSWPPPLSWPFFCWYHLLCTVQISWKQKYQDQKELMK